MVGFLMFGMVAQVLLRFRQLNRIPVFQWFKRLFHGFSTSTPRIARLTSSTVASVRNVLG
jgi:hypothetical protein